MRAFILLVIKDLRQELRRRELLSLLLSLSLMLCLIISLGVNSGFLTPDLVSKLFVPLFWIICVFLTTLTLGRCFEYDLEQRALDTVLLSAVPCPVIFLSKAGSNFVIMMLGELLSLFCLAAFLDVAIGKNLAALLVLLLMVSCALSALGTLLSALSMKSRLKGMLLPLISLPLCFPVYFCALELGWQSMSSAGLVWGGIWFNLLLFLDLLYMLLGMVLFEAAIRE